MALAFRFDLFCQDRPQSRASRSRICSLARDVRVLTFSSLIPRIAAVSAILHLLYIPQDEHGPVLFRKHAQGLL